MVTIDTRGLEFSDADMRECLNEAVKKGDQVIAAAAVSTYMHNQPQILPNKLGIRSSRLSRAVSGAPFRGANESKTTIRVSGSKVEYERTIEVEYAARHEYGFRGIEQVKAHTRGGVPVQAHTRNANTPARPYMEPAHEDSESEVAEIVIEELVRCWNNG